MYFVPLGRFYDLLGQHFWACFAVLVQIFIDKSNLLQLQYPAAVYQCNTISTLFRVFPWGKKPYPLVLGTCSNFAAERVPSTK